MKTAGTFKFSLITFIFIVSFAHSQNLDKLTLIAHYPLSSTANDTTGNYGPMDLTNTPFQDGGIYCNGNYIGTESDSCDAITPEITDFNFKSFGVSVKFKVNDVTSRKPVIMCGRYYRWLGLFTDPDTTVGLFLGGYFDATPSSSVKFTLGEWHEMTATYDSTEGIARLYLDDAPVDSASALLDHHHDNTFGITHGGASLVFKGFLKDFKLYSDITQQKMKQDSLALVALYNSTNGDSWTNNTNWLTGPVSTWHGVTIEEDRVYRIDLHGNNLVGTLPGEIGNLDNLYYLELSTNQLGGSIPPEIGNMTELTYLYLCYNQLDGTIPEEIQNATKIVWMILNDNQLSGSIPAEIGNLTNLQALNLSENQLTDSIPSEICNLFFCQYLYLRNNLLSGPIPSRIGDLTNLINLDLSNNQMTGPIPPGIGSLINLKEFRFSSNQFSGFLPPEMGNLIHCQVLRLYGNQLSGSIPSTLINLTQLHTLELNDNLFDDLPDLSSLSSLNSLDIAQNRFTFEDIEPNIGIPNFGYYPQDNVGEAIDTSVAVGQNLTLSVQVGGTANQYQWFKDGIEIIGADSSAYGIESITVSDSGSYICQITNTIATELTLDCRPIHVHVYGGTPVANLVNAIPDQFTLFQNYPNPFNPETTIRFDVKESCLVLLKVYNLLGQEVATLINQKYQPGRYEISFSASGFSSGLYFYKIQMGDFQSIKKMVVTE
ncbi:T9SS type A sorting domain-containing protein [bacterium]|nr:T9SS type A sorting domain-containing protein [bacterium]RQV96905.1 MAG: T9SS C-terminal target domain-containing protein [bacterium]